MYILFKPEFVSDILSGRKTQTRRRRLHFPLKEGEVIDAKTSSQSPVFARLRIEAIVEERLGNLTDESVAREGARDLAHFKEEWKKIYKSWNPEEECVAIDFVILKPNETAKGP